MTFAYVVCVQEIKLMEVIVITVQCVPMGQDRAVLRRVVL